MTFKEMNPLRKVCAKDCSAFMNTSGMLSQAASIALERDSLKPMSDRGINSILTPVVDNWIEGEIMIQG